MSCGGVFQLPKRSSALHTNSRLDLRLLEVLGCPLHWVHRDSVVDAISQSPRSYVQIETLLSHAAPFEHFWLDEVDKYDYVAQKLFGQATE